MNHPTRVKIIITSAANESLSAFILDFQPSSCKEQLEFFVEDSLKYALNCGAVVQTEINNLDLRLNGVKLQKQ